jgi:hypothetical protein
MVNFFHISILSKDRVVRKYRHYKISAICKKKKENEEKRATRGKFPFSF